MWELAEDALWPLLSVCIPTHFQRGSRVPYTENKTRSRQRSGQSAEAHGYTILKTVLQPSGEGLASDDLITSLSLHQSAWDEGCQEPGGLEHGV